MYLLLIIIRDWIWDHKQVLDPYKKINYLLNLMTSYKIVSPIKSTDNKIWCSVSHTQHFSKAIYTWKLFFILMSKIKWNEISSISDLYFKTYFYAFEKDIYKNIMASSFIVIFTLLIQFYNHKYFMFFLPQLRF